MVKPMHLMLYKPSFINKCAARASASACAYGDLVHVNQVHENAKQVIH